LVLNLEGEFPTDSLEPTDADVGRDTDEDRTHHEADEKWIHQS